MLIFGVDSDKELDEEESSLLLNISGCTLLSLLKSLCSFLGSMLVLKTAVFPSIPKMTDTVHLYFALT